MHIAPAASIRSRSPLIVRSRLMGSTAEAQMADDFRMMVVTAGGVINEDMLVIGWTQGQIDKHAGKARTRALAAELR